MSALRVVSAAIRSKVVVLLLLIVCPIVYVFVCCWSLFFNAVLCALFNPASISLRMRELVALL